MPIVLMSLSDKTFFKAASQMSEEYKEELVEFGQLDFRATQDSRVTFYAHGILRSDKSYAFGAPHLTVKEFAQVLLDKGLLESGIMDIDLVGCEIGLIKNNTNFIMEVADYLYKKGYQGRVNGFNNLVTEKEMGIIWVVAEMELNVHEKITYKLHGVEKAKMPEFVEEKEKRCGKLYQQIQVLDDKIIKNEKAQPNSPVMLQENQNLEEQIVKLESEINEIMDLLVSRVSPDPFFVTNKVRESLNRSIFQVTPQVIAEYKTWPKERLEAARIIHLQLDKLKVQLDYERNYAVWTSASKINKYNHGVEVFNYILKAMRSDNFSNHKVKHQLLERIKDFELDNINPLGKKMIANLQKIRSLILNESQPKQHFFIFQNPRERSEAPAKLVVGRQKHS